MKKHYEISTELETDTFLRKINIYDIILLILGILYLILIISLFLFGA